VPAGVEEPVSKTYAGALGCGVQSLVMGLNRQSLFTVLNEPVSQPQQLSVQTSVVDEAGVGGTRYEGASCLVAAEAVPHAV
jgi:hypothetical protein